jgi:hypothetical protein
MFGYYAYYKEVKYQIMSFINYFSEAADRERDRMKKAEEEKKKAEEEKKKADEWWENVSKLWEQFKNEKDPTKKAEIEEEINKYMK